MKHILMAYLLLATPFTYGTENSKSLEQRQEDPDLLLKDLDSAFKEAVLKNDKKPLSSALDRCLVLAQKDAVFTERLKKILQGKGEGDDQKRDVNVFMEEVCNNGDQIIVKDNVISYQDSGNEELTNSLSEELGKFLKQIQEIVPLTYLTTLPKNVKVLDPKVFSAINDNAFNQGLNDGACVLYSTLYAMRKNEKLTRLLCDRIYWDSEGVYYIKSAVDQKKILKMTKKDIARVKKARPSVHVSNNDLLIVIGEMVLHDGYGDPLPRDLNYCLGSTQKDDGADVLISNPLESVYKNLEQVTFLKEGMVYWANEKGHLDLYSGDFIISKNIKEGTNHTVSVYYDKGQWWQFNNQNKEHRLKKLEDAQKLSYPVTGYTILGDYQKIELSREYHEWLKRNDLGNSQEGKLFLAYLEKMKKYNSKYQVMHSVLSQNPTLLTSLIKEDKKEDVSQSSSQSIDDRINEALTRKEKIKQEEAEKRKERNKSRDEKINPSRKKEEDLYKPETFKLQKERNAWHNRYAE